MEEHVSDDRMEWILQSSMMGTRDRMLMPWTTAGEVGSLRTCSVLDREESASELEFDEEEDDEDKDETMAAAVAARGSRQWRMEAAED